MTASARRVASPPAARDRGAAEALGLVVLTPLVVGLALVVVWAGRSVHVEAQLRTAAEAGAQAAALERSHSAARGAADRAVRATLESTMSCTSVTVEVPESASRGVGLRFGVIEVTASCELDRGAVPTARPTRSATAWATVDRYRAIDRP